MRRVFAIVTIAALFILPFMVSTHLTDAQASPTVVNFTLYISENGINETSGNLTLGPVVQGETVVITFVWNDTAVPWNTHQMEIDGYNVTTDVISQETLTSTVEFSADVAGSFRIYCIIPCLGMAGMQNGWLLVIPTTGNTTSTNSEPNGNVSSTSNSSTSISIIGTSLEMTSMHVNGSELLATVRLSDSNGTGVSGMQVRFFIPTDFGKMLVGSSSTTINGTASLTYKLPSQWGGSLYASYAGSKNYEPSNVTAIIDYNLTSGCANTISQGSGVQQQIGSLEVESGENLSAAASGLQQQQKSFIDSGTCVNVAASASEAGPPYLSGQGNFIDFRLVGVPPVPAEVIMGLFIVILVSVYVVIVFALIQVIAVTKRRRSRVDE